MFSECSFGIGKTNVTPYKIDPNLRVILEDEEISILNKKLNNNL